MFSCISLFVVNKLNLFFISPSVSFSVISHKFENLKEQINDIQVEHDSSQDVLIWSNWISSSPFIHDDHLSIAQKIETEQNDAQDHVDHVGCLCWEDTEEQESGDEDAAKDAHYGSTDGVIGLGSVSVNSDTHDNSSS